MKILSFILGTIMGSFYLVLGTRLPKGEDIVKSRSRCDNCKKILKWYNLIPLVSFIVQKGKCSSCGQKISSEHFFAEIFTLVEKRHLHFQACISRMLQCLSNIIGNAVR